MCYRLKPLVVQNAKVNANELVGHLFGWEILKSMTPSWVITWLFKRKLNLK